MHRRIIARLDPRSWSFPFIVSLSLSLVALLLIARFVRPVPPDTLAMTTGMEGGSFVVFAERYRQVLARDGIRVELRRSSGVVENLRLLSDESQKIDASFVQGAVGKEEIGANLVSLGQSDLHTAVGFLSGRRDPRRPFTAQRETDRHRAQGKRHPKSWQ